MACITSSMSLHSSYLKRKKDHDAYSAYISAKGNAEYKINKGIFLVKLSLAESQSQITTFCQDDDREVIVHGRLVEFDKGLVMTILANPTKMYPVPTSDFQHPSILATAGTITKTSASSVSGGLTWFEISCAGSLTPSPRSSQSQSASENLRNRGNSDARTSSGSTWAGVGGPTFDDILSPNRRKYWSDDSSRTLCEKSYRDDEISGTIRRVGTSNSDSLASSAPATAYPPLATHSAAFPLPSSHSAPLSRPKANIDNKPPSGIQVDPRAKYYSSQGNWPIDRQNVSRPLFGSIDSVKLSQSNRVGRRTECGTLDERPSTPTHPDHRPPELFIPSKIPRAAFPAPKIAREGSFPSEAHDETARRSEELLWADIDNLQVNLGVGTEFDRQSIHANDLINPTLQAAKSTFRNRRRAIYGTPALFTNEASIPEEIAHREPNVLVETGSNLGDTALDNKQVQINDIRRRRDAVIFPDKTEFERLKRVSTSSRPSLTHSRTKSTSLTHTRTTSSSLTLTQTSSTTSAASNSLLIIRCFLPKGDDRFGTHKFPVGRALAVTGELQGFVGEGPDRIASIIVSEIASYSDETESAKIFNNCCGVSCTEEDRATTERLVVALDPIKVANMRDLIGRGQIKDDSPKSKGRDIMSKSPPDGVPRRPALAKLRKASSNINIKSKFTSIFTRSVSKTDIQTLSGSPKLPATSPGSANFDERRSLEHDCTGINATYAASLNPDEQSDYDLATPWSNGLTKSGSRQAELRQQLPRLRTAEAQDLARQPLLPNLSQFSPLSADSLSPNTEGLSLFEAELPPMKTMRQFDEPRPSVETRFQPSKRGAQPDRDLHIHPAAKKSAKSPSLAKRRNALALKLITDQSSGFPQRPIANDPPVGPVRYEASNRTALSPATCECSRRKSPPLSHHHRQQRPKICFPKLRPIWSISKKKRAKKIIHALNSGLPSPLRHTASTPNLNYYPSPSFIKPLLKQQRIRKSPSASNILPHWEQRVSSNVAAARSSAPVQKMEIIKEEDFHKEKEKENDAVSARSWYDIDCDSWYDEDFF